MLRRLQRLAYFPRYATMPDPQPGRGVTDLDRWQLETPEGPVEGWYMPAPDASAESPAPAVVFAHGNAELIDHWPQTLEGYRAMGVSVLLPELRGYGRSAGRPSERAIVEDFVRFHDRLTARPEVDASRVVLHGRSIGGGIVCGLARERRPAAMILMSTFTSLAAVAARYGMPRRLVSDPFDNASVVGALDVPLLVIHGTHDGIIPTAHGRALADMAPRARLVLYEADHNDCPPDWDRFFRDVGTFLVNAGILNEDRASPARL